MADYPKASLLSRLIAVLIDSVIISILSVLLVIPGLLYALLKDGMCGGRSIGKKLMGLRVIEVNSGQPCSYKDSVIRQIVMWIPLVGFIECVLVIIDGKGRRLGDKVAGTQVIPA